MVFIIKKKLYSAGGKSYWQVEERYENFFKALLVLSLLKEEYPHHTWRLSVSFS